MWKRIPNRELSQVSLWSFMSLSKNAMSEEWKIRKRIEYINKRIERLIEKIENLKPSDTYSIKKFTKEKIWLTIEKRRLLDFIKIKCINLIK